MAGEEFFKKLDFYVNAWMPARDLVQQAIDSRFEVDSSGQVMVFTQVHTACQSSTASRLITNVSQSMPWKEHFFELEKALNPEKPILYVLYPESSEKPEGNWRIQCVSIRADSFKNRKDMPDS